MNSPDIGTLLATAKVLKLKGDEYTASMLEQCAQALRDAQSERDKVISEFNAELAAQEEKYHKIRTRIDLSYLTMEGREEALREVLALTVHIIKGTYYSDGRSFEMTDEYIRAEDIRALLTKPAKANREVRKTPSENEADMDGLLLNALLNARNHLLKYGVASSNTEKVLLGAMCAVEELKRLRNAALKSAKAEGEE